MKKIELNNLPELGNYKQDSNNRLFLRYLSENNISEITPIAVRQYFEYKKPLHKVKYIKNLKTSLLSAIRLQLINENRITEILAWETLFKHIKLKASQTEVSKYQLVTDEQFNFLIRKLIKKGNYLTALLAINLRFLPIRPGELVKIKLSDCVKIKETSNNKESLEFYKVEVYSKKNGSKRFIIMPVELYQINRQYFNGKEFLFESPIRKKSGDRKGYSVRWIETNISNACSFILGKQFYPYLFRHTWATAYYNKTLDTVNGAKLLGNSPDTFSKVYTHTDIDAKQALSINPSEALVLLAKVIIGERRNGTM
ncbi:MAG: site-specific integrase [Leptospiraceae bacterium]|nr:site-specific integrase [Leptospiraceae bacterium]